MAAKRCSNDAGGSNPCEVDARGNVLLGRLVNGDPRRMVARPCTSAGLTGDSCWALAWTAPGGWANGLKPVGPLVDNGRRREPSTMSPKLKPRLRTRRWLDSAGAPKTWLMKLLPRLRAWSSKLCRALRLKAREMGRGACSWNGEPSRGG